MSKAIFIAGRDIPVQAVLPAAPGYAALNLVWEGDAVTGFEALPITGWGVCDLGHAPPVTPHCAGAERPVLTPAGAVIEIDETVHPNVENWFREAKAAAEQRRQQLQARRKPPAVVTPPVKGTTAEVSA